RMRTPSQVPLKRLRPEPGVDQVPLLERERVRRRDRDLLERDADEGVAGELLLYERVADHRPEASADDVPDRVLAQSFARPPGRPLPKPRLEETHIHRAQARKRDVCDRVSEDVAAEMAAVVVQQRRPRLRDLRLDPLGVEITESLRPC